MEGHEADCVVGDVPDCREYFAKVRGSDPRAVTCRGKLQYQRNKINQEINKHLLLRSGAEKLFKASTSKKMRESVALELNFVNSNLQHLKEQLADLNSSVQVYQSAAESPAMPMIPLGLKETKYINFKEPFMDFILEHYSEDGKKYEKSIEEFSRIRQAIRTPKRDLSGVCLLLEYYNLLYYVDHRFFPPHRNMGIYFEWFDSLTGIPAAQKTVAYEKACVLFNAAALYTQIGSNQLWTSPTGLDAAVDNFLRAAGIFRYIRDNFSNPPSPDLTAETLSVLTQLMLAQARECLLEKFVLLSSEPKDLEEYLDIAQETAEMSERYRQSAQAMSRARLRQHVPAPWISLVQVKVEHYAALAHRHVAEGLLRHGAGELPAGARQLLDFIHSPPQGSSDFRPLRGTEERLQLGRAHLREASERHQEALRLHRMCRQLRQVSRLRERLEMEAEQAQRRYLERELEPAIDDLLETPVLQPSTKFQLTLTAPDFSRYKRKDLFHALGPIQAFSARRSWTAARTLVLRRWNTEQSFGIALAGDCPVTVTGVEGPAQEAGLKEGDYIVEVAGRDIKWAHSRDVAELIRRAGSELRLRVVTPVVQPPRTPSSTSSGSPSLSSASTGSSGSKRLSWNPFSRRRSRSRDKLDYRQNIFLRRSITDLTLQD